MNGHYALFLRVRAHFDAISTDQALFCTVVRARTHFYDNSIVAPLLAKDQRIYLPVDAYWVYSGVVVPAYIDATDRARPRMSTEPHLC